jgi:hypothetical protein
VNLAVDGQVDRRGHHDLAARVGADRSAERAFLLDPAGADAELVRTQHRRDARRAGAHHEKRQRVVGWVERFVDRIDRLHTLANGRRDEAHAAELARDVDAALRGFEPRVDLGEIDAAARAAEHELDRVDRAGAQALAVTDASGRVREASLTRHDHERTLFGAGAHTGT